MKMVYSENQEIMVNIGFTYKGNHYTWDEQDEGYYRDDVDDVFYTFIPDGAIVD